MAFTGPFSLYPTCSLPCGGFQLSPPSPSLTLKLDDQIFGDPDAADIVFTSGADVVAVGINVTHQVVFTGTFWQIGLCTVNHILL